MSGRTATILAQAKLNLYLRVLAREESGYHSIETIFHRIDFADEITIHVLDDHRRALDTAGHYAGPAESNLAYRAAVAYQLSAGWPAGFSIELTKHIPPGGGLGGGSADAAAVLRALDSLTRYPLGEPKLMLIASSLGADVPFLASSEVMALAWGHGERMMALPPLPQRDVLLVMPEFNVRTADAYAWLDEERAALSEDARYGTTDLLLTTEQKLSQWKTFIELHRNDFVHPVSARYPQVRELLDGLKSTGAILCSMSGSGSTLFGVYEQPPRSDGFPGLAAATAIVTRTATQVVQPVCIG